MMRNWKKIASVVYGYAIARLALNTYLYFGELPLEYEQGTGKQEELDRRYMELLGWHLDGEYAKVLEKIEDFRREIRQEMETVVAYSDAVQIYEYVLNRIERRFVNGLSGTEMEIETLVGNVMRYLASAKDSTLQNQRIHEILRQLPIRFTRQKYFSMVHDALTTYLGADYTGLEEVMYLLRCGSLIEFSQRYDSSYGKLNGILDDLRDLSFKDLTKESYDKTSRQVKEAGELLLNLTEYYNHLGEMVNDLYLLCLTGPEAMRDVEKEASAFAILRGLWGQYGKGSRKIPQDIFEHLPNLEGVQEEYFEKYQQLSFHQEEETDPLVSRVDRLMSTSTFADLEENQRQGHVTREDLEEVVATFFAELETIFSSSQKPVMRAIMATTLSYLPICFHSPDELQCYIRNSLDCCTDLAERAICMELLQQMMEMDGYELV
jgi:hypothetical protein